MTPPPSVPLIDPDPVARHQIEQLLQQMTLEEKIGQMVQVDLSWKQDIPQLVREGRIGSLLSTRDLATINRYQRIAVQESRLGIPLLVGNDVLHGYKTIFPIPLAEACTWDLALIETCATAIASEAAAAGTTWNYAPMVDICRDPRWGRIAEGAGEDPWLGSQVAAARVRGIQSANLPGGRRIAACVKHFAAYGAAEAGKDYNTVDMSERRLRDEYLPPYRAAIQAGAASLMTAFNELNGIPATANPFLLQRILREEWGFQGVIISDYDSIGELIHHGFARDHREASLLSVLAGVDIDMMGDGYHFHLADLVREGLVPENCIDAAVRRILLFKHGLGIFANPYYDEENVQRAMLLPAPRALALRAAQDSMVLLKNEGGLLPLDPPPSRIAVIGPLADERQSLLGSWFCEGEAKDVTSLLDGLREVFPNKVEWIHETGCAINANEHDFSAAVAAARLADLVILALGESDAMSGEAHSRAHLGLPGSQQALAEAVCAVGKPVVVVLFCGRPLVIPWLVQHANAILLAWQGGTLAGLAAANLLAGIALPSARLTVTFPRSEGQIPIYYAHKRTGRPADLKGILQFNQEHKSIYLDESNQPLYPFGYGLSYTTFEYLDLIVETPCLSMQDTLVVSVIVANSGQRDGWEVVQCYVSDRFGSVTRPVKELKAFQKIHLNPGEQRRVRFEIPVSDLGFTGADLNYRVEAGEFRVWIGAHSQTGLEGDFRVESASATPTKQVESTYSQPIF